MTLFKNITKLIYKREDLKKKRGFELMGFNNFCIIAQLVYKKAYFILDGLKKIFYKLKDKI